MIIVQTESKVAKIKKAIEVSEKAYLELLGFIKVGISELEVKAELERLQYEYGAEKMAFDTIVAASENACEFHHISNDTKIKDGDILMIDFGCVYEGYHSDITRTIFIGQENKEDAKQVELLKIYNIVNVALEKAILEVKDGATCKQVDFAARSVIEQAGYGENFPHSTGHGLGLEIHEAPRISYKSDEVLKEGMVVTIEPGIYIEGLGGVRIEEDVLVTKDGCEILTSVSTKLTWI